MPYCRLKIAIREFKQLPRLRQREGPLKVELPGNEIDSQSFPLVNSVGGNGFQIQTQN